MSIKSGAASGALRDLSRRIAQRPDASRSRPIAMLPHARTGQLVQLHDARRRGLRVAPTPAPEPGGTRRPSTAFRRRGRACDSLATGWRRRQPTGRAAGAAISPASIAPGDWNSNG